MNKNLIEMINRYLANIGVSYIKMHNLHWNVVGPAFKVVHEYLEGIYDAYADVLDEVAELLRMNGALPAASLKEYLALADIEELPSEEISISDALAILLDDMKHLKAQAAAIRAAADEEGAFETVAMMEDQISQFNKDIWFVESMGK